MRFYGFISLMFERNLNTDIKLNPLDTYLIVNGMSSVVNAKSRTHIPEYPIINKWNCFTKPTATRIIEMCLIVFRIVKIRNIKPIYVLF